MPFLIVVHSCKHFYFAFLDTELYNVHPISWMQSCSTIEWLASSNEPLGDFGPFEIIRQQSMPATWTNNDRSTGIVSRIRSIDCELGLGNVGNKVNRLLGNEFFPALSKFAFGWYFRSFAGSRSWQSVIISGSPAKPNGMSLKKTLHAMIAARERNRWIIILPRKWSLETKFL